MGCACGGIEQAASQSLRRYFDMYLSESPCYIIYFFTKFLCSWFFKLGEKKSKLAALKGGVWIFIS